MKKGLIVWGGWDGHEPEQVAGVCKRELALHGVDAEVTNDMAALEDVERLKALHVIVPVITMSEISDAQCDAVVEAVANGTGLAGCHGGMCDAFRNSVKWQFMTGGNWVAHPGADGTDHEVNIRNSSSMITDGLKDFKISSEQYYLHVDPAVEVLATTRFPVANGYHVPNGAVDMPVTWTKRWGAGRVFYTSLGHHADIFDIPEALAMMSRGLKWAAEGKDVAVRDGLTAEPYKSDRPMF